jgi:hypothetical protein
MMTVAEFQKLAAVAEAVARIEERQKAHEAAHAAAERRVAGVAPWLSTAAALIALAVSLFNLVR